MSWKLSKDVIKTLREKYLQIETIYGNTITLPTVENKNLERLGFSRFLKTHFGIEGNDLKDWNQASACANHYLLKDEDHEIPNWLPRQANSKTIDLCLKAGLRIERLVSIGLDSDASVKGNLGSHEVHITTGLEKSFVEKVPHHQRIRVTFPGKASWSEGVLELHKINFSDIILKSLEGRPLNHVMEVDVEGWEDIHIILANNIKKNMVRIKTSASDKTQLF